MATRVFNLVSRAPRLVLALAVVALVGLGALTALSIEDLSPRGLSAPGSESEQARTDLAEELGYDPVPAIRLVLVSPESFNDPASGVALATLVDSAATAEGVIEVVEGPLSEDERTTSLRLHFPLDEDPAVIERATAELDRILDPGLLDLQIAGEVPAAAELQDQLLDDAPKLAAIAIPFALLVLVGIVGVRFGLLAFACGLLGAELGIGGALLAGALVDVSAATVVAGAICGLALGAETCLALVVRYREEGAILGSGSEAIEYSIVTSWRGFLIGSLAAVGTGLALVLVAVEPLASLGFGLIAAGALAPLAALVVSSAALLAGVGEPAGTAMPMVSEEGAPEGASRGFRILVALAGSRRRALAVAVACLAALAVAIWGVLDTEAVGGSPQELDTSAVKAADATLNEGFGGSADAPLLIVVDGAPETPTTTIYRDILSGFGGVASVAAPTPAGASSTFELIPESWSLSLPGQQTVAGVRGFEGAPAAARLLGRPAALADATDELADGIPLVALILLLVAAAVAFAGFRSPSAPVLMIAGALPAAAALGLTQLVFGDGFFSGPFDYEPAGAPHLITPVLVGGVLLAIGLFRSSTFTDAVFEERALGAGARGALARAGAITILPALGVGLVAAGFAGAWLGSDLLVAKEVGFGLAVGLLIDSLVVRPLLAPALTRLTISS